MSVQRLTPNPDWQPVGKNFYRQKAGELHAETAQSALTVIFTLITDGLNSLVLIVQLILQFQGQFVSTSLRPVLGTVAACVSGTV